MITVKAYLYPNTVTVQVFDPAIFTVRNRVVYSRTIKVYQGIDNPIQIIFQNQDQKPVNITGSEFKFRLLNQTGDQVLIEKPMTILAPTVGRAKVVLDIADTIDLIAEPASYSIQRSQGSYVEAVYVDANAQARADCNIVDSVLPQFIPSKELTIPTIYGKAQQLIPGPTNWPDWALYPQPVNTTQLTEFYSSHMPTSGQSLTTISMDMVGYTGTVKFQAAENYESIWYDVTENWNYFNETSTQYFNVVGYYPLIRACFNNSQGFGAQATAYATDGVITSIDVTNAGSGYLAPPHVQILGDGAGATAVVTGINGGSIGPIEVTSGGSGYLPIQYQGTQIAKIGRAHV